MPKDRQAEREHLLRLAGPDLRRIVVSHGEVIGLESQPGKVLRQLADSLDSLA